MLPQWNSDSAYIRGSPPSPFASYPIKVYGGMKILALRLICVVSATSTITWFFSLAQITSTPLPILSNSSNVGLTSLQPSKFPQTPSHKTPPDERIFFSADFPHDKAISRIRSYDLDVVREISPEMFRPTHLQLNYMDITIPPSTVPKSGNPYEIDKRKSAYRFAITDQKHFLEDQTCYHLAEKYSNMGAIDFDLERRLVPDLVGILASWSEFSEKHDIPTWIAHGTLLGWFWNQRILPWDTDLDFQVPVQSLATLTALNLTRSSDGRYVLEVNPHAAYRMRQENNTIDARWIDMRTGLFLDITALSNTYSIRAKDTPKHASSKISCKNGHQSSHYEISPLVLTRLEGVKVWRPARPLTLLKREYEEISMQSRFWNYRGEQFVFDEEEMRWKCYMVNVPADDSAEELRIAKESWCKEK